MLNPKELMLGSWVYESERSQFPMQVVNIDKDMVYLDFEGNEGDVFEGRMDDICPIQLTEEILLKNEFKREESLIGICFHRGFNDEISFISIIFRDNMFRMIVLDDFKEINYVHQLQNILTITGIDIEFKI